MSQTVDSRIVEMRFDNKQFESGAKTTMSTLYKLKEALKLPDSSSALEGIDKAAKGIKLDGIAAGVEALEKRFSTMGIVGMRVIENITDGLMNKLNVAVNFVSNSIVSGGIKRAMNIENAHFQLQALLKDEAKVQAVMADAMESVDGTAYAYDEAAKAASQFAASGIQAGEDMLNALKGITGVAAMTNSSFEDVSRIFTTVAGNGRLMGDQLLQLSSRGLNAASTLADYFREVRNQSAMTEADVREMVSKGKISFKDFSDAMTWAFGDSAKRANETFTGSLSNVKSALARIGAGFISPLVEQNGELVQLFNALRIKINDVKSSLVFDEQRSAISGLAEVTKISKDELSEMFKTIKSNGKVSIDDLDTLSKKGANATDALTKYVNGVVDGSIRASYAITNALGDLTEGTKVSTEDIRRFVEEGKIDLDTFTAAMETTFGNEKTLSKQFTDFFLDHIHMIVEAINAADMTKPMEVFHYWVESVKNVAKGLLSVLNPIGKAFADVFFVFDGDDIITFSEAVERLTSKMKLSEKGSKNLHDAFKGIFSVVKLLVDIFVKLLKAIIPINEPIGEMGDGFLDLIGFVGRALIEFTEMIRSCELLKKAFKNMSNGFSIGTKALTTLIKKGKEFLASLSDSEKVTKLVNSVTLAFEELSKKAGPYINDFIKDAEKIFKSLFNLENISLDDVLNTISKTFSDLGWEIKHFSFKTVEDAFESLTNKIKSLRDLFMSNDGLSTFVKNAKKFGEDLKEAFTWDNLMDRLEKIMEVFGKFFNWIKNTMGPAFEDFNVGSAIGVAGGFGVIYAMIKALSVFEKIGKTTVSLKDSISGLLGSIKGTLVAYQKELKAEALLKTAAAIAVLAGALVLLSFTDTDRLLEASVALAIIAGTLMFGVSKLLDAVNKGKEMNDALTIFSKGLSKSMKKLATAVQIKAVGSAIKNFAISIAIIAASIIALGVMYNKDKDSLMAAVDLVKVIGLALVGIMAGMSILGNLLKGGGMKNFSQAALGILSLSLTLTLCINALNKLFKMEFPSDWEFKVKILAGMLAGLGVLALALGVASRLAGENKMSSGMILSMAALLITTVFALNKLFKMEFPSDWQEKLTILGLIFTSFGALMIIMGAASRLAGGSIKAAGTILSMCVFIGVIVAALMVLTLIPGDKLLKGAKALGIVLTTLGIALYGAGKIVTKDIYKTVLAMALVVGAITAALAVLAMVPFSKLLKGSVALGLILIILAENFKQVSKIKNEQTWITIAAMIAAVLGIAYSLHVLAEQPWRGLLAAAASLSSVLLALAQTLKMISSMSGLKIQKIELFLLAITSLIPIGVALYVLSEQPWGGMLAAAASMSAVLLAFGQTMKTISALRGIKLEKISLFLMASLALAPIGIALYALTGQPWSGMLAAGVALSGTLLALAGAFSIISATKPDLMAMATFLAASVNVGLIAFSIYELAKQPWENLLAASASLSLVLLAMSGAMAICALVGAAGAAALIGIGLLDLFIANFALVLVALGAIFQSDGARALMSGGAEILVQLGQTIGDFVGAIINGVLTGVANSLPAIGKGLSGFMENLDGFIEGSKKIDSEVLKGVGILAACIIAITAAEVISGIGFFLGGAAGLVSMAENLVLFTITLEPFLKAVKGIDADSMIAVKNLAEMIIMLTAAELLSGIGRFFGLSGSITDFGKELSEFGSYIKEFAEEVKDVNPESVEGAAAAAEIMAEMAKKLPGTGGLVQKIFGEKNLAEFGEELVKFGPAIKEFAEEVKDVNPESVEGAAAAAEIMAELANKLPSQGGFAQKVFGTKSLAEFGEELVAFGPKIVSFAKKVVDVKPEAVQGAAAAAEIMSELANNLPSSDSMWDKIFGGGQVTLSEFGEELVKFGTSMVSFSDTVSGVNTSKINKVIDNFKDLIILSNDVQGASGKDLVNFADQLSQIGADSVDNFVLAFTDSNEKVKSGIAVFLTMVLEALKSKDSEFTLKGVTSAEKWLTGIVNKYVEANVTGMTLATRALTGLEFKMNDFLTKGISAAANYLAGIERKYEEAVTKGRNLANNAVSGCQSLYSSFYSAGESAGGGFVSGLHSKMSEAIAAGEALGNAAYNAAKRALDIHSPSRKMGEVGENAGLGFINNLMLFISKAAMIGKDIGEATLNGISLVMMDDVSDPVITPTVDFTNLNKAVDEIRDKFSDAVQVSATLAATASSTMKRKDGTSIPEQTAQNGETPKTVVTYNQYNNSPKALSRIEIYRHTKNQLSQFETEVNQA